MKNIMKTKKTVTRKKSKLMVYVWKDFSPDYTSGLAVAIASSENDAKKQVIKEHGYDPSGWGEVVVYPLHKKQAFTVSGGG